MKLKRTVFDNIFRSDRFKEIIYLRGQINTMIDKFESLSIIERLSKYPDINSKIFNLTLTTLNEVKMYNELGERSVIDRLTKDRDNLISILEGVTDIDISDIKCDVRTDKINKIITPII